MGPPEFVKHPRMPLRINSQETLWEPIHVPTAFHLNEPREIGTRRVLYCEYNKHFLELPVRFRPWERGGGNNLTPQCYQPNRLIRPIHSMTEIDAMMENGVFQDNFHDRQERFAKFRQPICLPCPLRDRLTQFFPTYKYNDAELKMFGFDLDAVNAESFQKYVVEPLMRGD